MTNYVSVDQLATASPQPILSPSGSQSFMITKAQVVNVGASSASISLFRVPAGGVASIYNTIVGAKVVAASASNPSIFEISGQVVENGKTLQIEASASGSSLVVSISYAVNTNL